MARWQEVLFALMSRDANNVASFFRLPNNCVIELGTQVQIRTIRGLARCTSVKRTNQTDNVIGPARGNRFLCGFLTEGRKLLCSKPIQRFRKVTA